MLASVSTVAGPQPRQRPAVLLHEIPEEQGAQATPEFPQAAFVWLA
jgi:hypothetical protein